MADVESTAIPDQAAGNAVTSTSLEADGRQKESGAAVDPGEALRQWELRGGPRQCKRQPTNALPLELSDETPVGTAKLERPLDVDTPGAVEELQLPNASDSEDDHFLEDPSEWAELHPTFAIKVYRLGGGAATTVDIYSGASASVRELKLAVMLATGVPCSLQQLTHESAILCHDEKTLSEVGLEHGMSIILDEQESHSLTEAELAQLQDDFLKRIDDACTPAVELDLSDLSAQERYLAGESPTNLDLDLPGSLEHGQAQSCNDDA